MIRSNLQHDHKVWHLIEGKSIALVGPAPTLTGLGMGDLINSYDLVCRVNKGFVIPEALHKDYGNRCDILFHDLNKDHVDNELLEDLDFFQPGVLCCPICKYWTTWNRLDSFEVIEEKGVYCYHAGDDLFYDLANDMKYDSPNTGFVSLCFLLQFPIKELFFAGFSFYKTPETYYEGHRLHGRVDPVGQHAQEPQIQYFKEHVYGCFKNTIKVDPWIQENILGDQK